MSNKQQSERKTTNPPMGYGWRNAWVPVWDDRPVRSSDKDAKQSASTNPSRKERR